MKILALEFSSQRRSAAVAEVGANGQVKALGSAEESDFRGVTGLMLIDRALEKAAVKPAEISLIAVGLGPGSYTGIRSAIAIAQGWQLGREVKVTGVSSALCLAEEARRREFLGEVTVIVDAQRGDVYLERYQLSPEGPEVLEPLRIIPVSAIPRDGIVIGPEASKFFPGATDLCATAETLAMLAQGGTGGPAEHLEPVYLRETTFVKAPTPRHIGAQRKE